MGVGILRGELDQAVEVRKPSWDTRSATATASEHEEYHRGVAHKVSAHRKRTRGYWNGYRAAREIKHLRNRWFRRKFVGMIKSMTGYGKGSRLWQDKKLGIEIRCVNSKVLDATWRWSGPYKELENELRGVVADRLQRGKVEISVSVRREGEDTGRLPSLRTAYMDAAYAQLQAWCAGKMCAAQKPGTSGNSPEPHSASQVQAWWPVLMAQGLMAQPEAWNRAEEEYSEDELRAAGVELRTLLNEVLDAVDGFRKQEGATLKQDLLHRVSLIEQKLSEIEPFEQGRLPRIKEKLQKALQEWDAQWESRSEVRARFEEGLIYYLEKWDVTEEKVRLSKHCRYFRESVDEEGAGKKLGFIAQEMGREINTLGSKSNEVEMQKKVVEMKDELEKIKEQLFNIL